MKKIYLLILPIFLFLCNEVFSQAGTLDPSFYGVGYKYTSLAPSSLDNGNAVAIQSDGKIVVVGNSLNGSVRGLAVTRFITNGSGDASFGISGKLILQTYNVDQSLTSVALQSDGKILAAGYYQDLINNNRSFITIRINTNGTLDNTFGTNGQVITDFGTGQCIAWSVAVQQDGKIIVGGENFTGGYRDFALVRYYANGTPDPTFGINGKKITSVSTTNDYCRKLLIQPNGKIVATGAAEKSIPNKSVAVIRYQSNGITDNTFGMNGIVTTDLGITHDSQGFSAALQPDGKIVVSGTDYNSSTLINTFLVLRYNINGSLDASFKGGFITTQIQHNAYGQSIVLQSDGKIVVAGWCRTTNILDVNCCIARYFTNGTLDKIFGTSGTGIVLKDFGVASVSEEDLLTGIALQSDGKIVVAGSVRNSFSNPPYFILTARYLANSLPLAKTNYNQSQTIKLKETKPFLYPNPANDFISINGLNANTVNRLTISTLQGNVLKEVSVSNSSNYAMHIETLPRGSFVLTIISAGKTTSFKFIKD